VPALVVTHRTFEEPLAALMPLMPSDVGPQAGIAAPVEGDSMFPQQLEEPSIITAQNWPYIPKSAVTEVGAAVTGVGQATPIPVPQCCC